MDGTCLSASHARGRAAAGIGKRAPRSTMFDTMAGLFAVVACVGAVALGVRIVDLATAADAAPLECPVGLPPEACVPPGAVAGLFDMGEPLPPDLAVERVEHPERLGLAPPPAGHYYAWVRSDLLLVAAESRRVVASAAHLGTR